MGTKKEYNELQKILKDEVSSYPFLSREWKESDRKFRLSEILNDLGFLPEYDYEFDAMTVEYRNRRYICDVIRVDILSIFSVIAQFDEDDLDEEGALAIADIIHEVNASEKVVKIYVAWGEVVVSSEQFLGKRKLEEDEVAFLLRSMDNAARVFRKYAKVNELVNDFVVCR